MNLLTTQISDIVYKIRPNLMKRVHRLLGGSIASGQIRLPISSSDISDTLFFYLSSLVQISVIEPIWHTQVFQETRKTRIKS
jgi:hypothetical protein